MTFPGDLSYTGSVNGMGKNRAGGGKRKMKMRDVYAMYRWIVEYKAAHNGNSPVVREIMLGCHRSSTSAVQIDLRRLARAGLIRCNKRRSRSLEIVGSRWVPPEPG